MTSKIEIIKGDLILTKDTVFKTSIKVEGNIKGNYNLKVAGNIDARNIDALNIVALNIDARNIDVWNIDALNIVALNIVAGNIDAWNIVALNIDARNIVCEKRIKKSEKVKTISRVFIQDKSRLERKEQMPSGWLLGYANCWNKFKQKLGDIRK